MLHNIDFSTVGGLLSNIEELYSNHGGALFLTCWSVRPMQVVVIYLSFYNTDNVQVRREST
jgi:hypothetical protein